VAQKLIQSGQVVALLGPTLSNSAVAVHPLAESLKTPIVAVSTTGIHIVPDCNYPKPDPCRYVFRDSLGEETAIPDNIKAYAAKAHPKTGVLLVAKDDKFSSDGGGCGEEVGCRQQHHPPRFDRVLEERRRPRHPGDQGGPEKP